MKRIGVALLIGASACGVFRRDQDNPTAQSLRLCVQNATVGYGNVIARADLVRFDVMPGRQVCKLIAATGASVVLTAESTGGGSNGPLRFATRLNVGGGGCWRWRISDQTASQVDLTPCSDADDRDGESMSRP